VETSIKHRERERERERGEEIIFLTAHVALYLTTSLTIRY